MSLEAKVGERRFFKEEGNIIEVEVLEVKPIEMGSVKGKNPGTEYTLKTIRVVEYNPIMVEEAHPEIGEVFTVSRADECGAYAGWHLTERA